jgi:hypothetical protein
MSCASDSHSLRSWMCSSNIHICQQGQYRLSDGVGMSSRSDRQYRWHSDNPCAGNRLVFRDNHQRLCIHSRFSHRQRLHRQRHPYQRRISIVDNWLQRPGSYMSDWNHHHQQQWCRSLQLSLYGTVDCPGAHRDRSWSPTNRRRFFG